MRKASIDSSPRCSICGRTLTLETVHIGDYALLCPLHALWALRGRLRDPVEWYHCIECGDPVQAADVWMDDDGPRCEACGRHRRVVKEAA